MSAGCAPKGWRRWRCLGGATGPGGGAFGGLAPRHGRQVAPLLVLAALTGCATPDESAFPPAKAAIGVHETQTVPAGAVAVDEGLYQVPVGSDPDGCLMYRLHAPARLVPLAISYRATDGSFTMDHRRALCDPELIRRR